MPDTVSYDNIFRMIIMQFLDAQNFDVRSVKKTCVHIVHPDGRIIPFDTFNMFYRDGKEELLTCASHQVRATKRLIRGGPKPPALTEPRLPPQMFSPLRASDKQVIVNARSFMFWNKTNILSALRKQANRSNNNSVPTARTSRRPAPAMPQRKM